ncbi:MAG: hypothetical protein ACE5EO_10600 [Candidatus Krumholzibacteriia bacterium]
MKGRKAPKFDKLELLEARISQVAERFAQVEAACRAHEEKNTVLEKQLDELRSHNNELSKQIYKLKTAKAVEPAALVGEKKILNKIDRMLEKFGELQI